MTPEQEKFLNEIAAELKKQACFGDRAQLFFPLRFDKNRPVAVQHKEIAKQLMPKDPLLGGVNYATSIDTTVQNVVSAMVGKLKTQHKKAISGLYEAEMRADGVDVDSLLNRKRGEKGSWEVVYNWLWNYKYLRWLDENGWKILQEKAKINTNWIQFLTQEEMASVQRGTRGLILPPPPPSVQKTTPTMKVVKNKNLILPHPPTSVQKIPPMIAANQSLSMVIEFKCLNYRSYQLLLLYSSQQGQCLLCPSSAYAPNSIMEEPLIVLPQKESWAAKEENKTNFRFEEAGKEEFLAIVLEEPLSLPWLIPREDEAVPEWNAEQIKELFEQLEQQGNWQVFYQNFEVVETVRA